MPRIVLLKDGKTWAGIEGCVVVDITEEQLESLNEGAEPAQLDIDSLNMVNISDMKERKVIKRPSCFKFKYPCPNCGNTDIEMIVTGETSSYPIRGLNKETCGEAELVLGKREVLDSDDDPKVHFVCTECQSTIRDKHGDIIEDATALSNRLLERRAIPANYRCK